MKDNMYHFSLANHGDTIPEEFQQKIFEKFVQIEGYTVSSSMGVGLGLAFCKMAVDAHSGFIKVVSPVPEFGDGVRLEIFLPQTITSNKEVVPAISTR